MTIVVWKYIEHGITITGPLYNVMLFIIFLPRVGAEYALFCRQLQQILFLHGAQSLSIFLSLLMKGG